MLNNNNVANFEKNHKKPFARLQFLKKSLKLKDFKIMRKYTQYVFKKLIINKLQNYL